MRLNAKTLTTARTGFTLIELLMVLTIIGILAAVAVPKFVHVRERAHFKALQSDLRNLMAQQEVYYAQPTSNFSYSNTPSGLTNFVTSQGVTVFLSQAGSSGFAATASHAALQTNEMCAVFVGTVPAVPSPAITPGVVTCTGE